MVTGAREALNVLSGVVQSLLPVVADPDLRPSLLVNPVRVTPTGLGGYIGVHPDPRGGIYGTRLEAAAIVVAKAADESSLNIAVQAVTQALVAADPAEMRRRGVLRVSLENVGQRSEAQSASGPRSHVARELTFRIVYEHVRLPREAEGTINEIALELDLSGARRQPEPLLDTTFVQGSLAWFDVVDDPAATRSRPSDWRYNPVEQRIEQLSNIRGGQSRPDPEKPGTYLVLRTDESRHPVQDLVLETTLRADDDDGIGLVFRWQDVNNFYFFLMDGGRGYRLFAKKVEGAFQRLADGGLDVTRGFIAGRRYRTQLVANGDRFLLYLDGELALQGQDASILRAGRVGFMCRGNNAAYFYDIKLVPR